MATRVGMVSLGCPKNQVDAEHMLYDLRKEGFQIVSDAALSDVVIINTCGYHDDIIFIINDLYSAYSATLIVH